ncbi:RNA-directed DNA polymerase, eukaryota, reverse transcriptase zinc-binding domain protein [Tanacetum coccineum]
MNNQIGTQETENKTLGKETLNRLGLERRTSMNERELKSISNKTQRTNPKISNKSLWFQGKKTGKKLLYGRSSRRDNTHDNMALASTLQMEGSRSEEVRDLDRSHVLLERKGILIGRTDLISDVQSVFVSNRQILDGPFILNELLSWCKHKKFKAMVFKVDFEKAFDLIKWDYLEDVLKKFGFGDKWCGWINGCLKSAMGSVLVNGSPTSEFQFYKGLKQRDPLSPFLFILIMESLHLSFKKVMNAGMFVGILLENSVTVSHLFYADDAIFVGKWDILNINTIVKVLKCFHMASRLKINLHKSKLMGIGVHSEEVEKAARYMGCATFSTPFTHLGVKVGGLLSRINSWEDFVSKVSSRLSKWKLKTLSIGDRLTLIKSVLSSIPLYQMSIFKVPKKVLNTLESIRRNFFNGIEGKDRKMSWISWNKVLASKKYGGLGVSSFFAFNPIYDESGSLDSPYPSSRRSPWLDIVREITILRSKGIDLLPFIRKKVGNREDTLFWEDIWLDGVILKQKYPRLYALELDKRVTVVDKLNHSSLVWSYRWDPRGGIEEEQQRLLHSCIGGVILPNMLDRWVWSLEASGEFSVKSVRSHIDDTLLPKEDVRTRWVNVVPIKINVFAWRVRLDKLPTRSNLSLRGVEISSILCPLCNSSMESAHHLFFTCYVARLMWRKVLRWWEFEDINIASYDEWLIWLKNIRLSRRLKDIFEGVCYVKWWLIWRLRNQTLFGDSHPRKDMLFDDLVNLSFQWCSSRGSGYHQKDRKSSQNDKTEHGMEKTVQNQGQSPKMTKSESILKNQQSNRSRN